MCRFLLSVFAVFALVSMDSIAVDAQDDAQFHYRVGKVALDNGDLEIALREFAEAARLAPDNGVMRYNLAVVQQKTSRPLEALAHLRAAIKLGLPDDLKAKADEMLPVLTYETERATRAGNETFDWLRDQRPLAMVAAGRFEGRYEFVRRGFKFVGDGCDMEGMEWRNEGSDPERNRETVARAPGFLRRFQSLKIVRARFNNQNTGTLFENTSPFYYVVSMTLRGQASPLEIVTDRSAEADRLANAIQTAAEFCRQ
jgi:tetratricopeptide (TPR) repeat protein